MTTSPILLPNMIDNDNLLRYQQKQTLTIDLETENNFVPAKYDKYDKYDKYYNIYTFNENQKQQVI